MYLSGLISKEFGRIKSDKRTLVLIFIIPIILIVIFGLTSGGGPTEHFNAAIITRDKEHCSECFNNTSGYDEIFIDVVEDECDSWGLYEDFESEDDEEYEKYHDICVELLKNEIIDVFLVLPEDFSETVENDTDTTIIYYVDGSDLQKKEAVEVAESIAKEHDDPQKGITQLAYMYAMMDKTEKIEATIDGMYCTTSTV